MLITDEIAQRDTLCDLVTLFPSNYILIDL